MKRSYFDIPTEYSDLKKARFVILPLPYEQTTTFIKGTAHGPEALRAASAQVELFDEETGAEPHLEGIHSAPPVRFGKTQGEKALQKIHGAIFRYVEAGKFVAAIGGEHSVTAGIAPVYSEKYRDLSVLHIDAHPDLRDVYEGSRHNHACVGRRIMEYAPLVQVGVRAWCAEQDAFMKKAAKQKIKGRRALTVFPAHEIAKSKDWIKRVIDALSPRVYLTLDLDGLDPSVIPAVGTPEPGGLQWRETLELLREVIREKTLVGMDMVELCPKKGDITGEFAAARLLHKILAFLTMN